MKSLFRVIGTASAALCLAFATSCAGGHIPGETQTFDGIEFQWCPPGTYMMGSPSNETDREADETRHAVTITFGFWLGKYEVTQAQWKAVMGHNPSKFSYFDNPVEQVSWDDVQDFIDALNGAKGVAALYRLPTESEWEYACRAGTTSRFYWGDDPSYTAIDDYAWYSGNSASATHVVGGKMPNLWGLYDMSGNVYEWCQDRYGDYPVGGVTDPQGPGTGNTRVVRGGSWEASSESCRSANRESLVPANTSSDLGFRLVRMDVPN